MKTASINDLGQSLVPLLAWLQAGETILLLENNGKPLGRFVPETLAEPGPTSVMGERFKQRFAPLATVPERDLSEIVMENRGPA